MPGILSCRTLRLNRKIHRSLRLNNDSHRLLLSLRTIVALKLARESIPNRTQKEAREHSPWAEGRRGRRLFPLHPNRATARACALAASASRLRWGAVVSIEWSRSEETRAISSMAALKAASLGFEGWCMPVILRTNCIEAARTSSEVTGGSKLKSVLMLRHMVSPGFPDQGPGSV